MFNRRFMEELFKPQELYNKKALRTMFDRIAHSSIMRLNAASMDKLYDLMTMAVKHQLFMAPRPRDILLITLNHLDTLYQMVGETNAISTHIGNVYRLILHAYKDLPDGQFHLIRQTLLQFFQDIHVRVSIFLKEKKQANNGRFFVPIDGKLPFGVDLPGTIRFISDDGTEVSVHAFPAGGALSPQTQEGSFELTGNRIIKLGLNMYLTAKSNETSVQYPSANQMSHIRSDLDEHHFDPNAKAQLDLLMRLIGSDTESQGKSKKTLPPVKLSLFSSDEEELHSAKLRPAVYASGDSVMIDASKVTVDKRLTKVMKEMDVGAGAGGDETGSDDLLDLMDQAGKT